MSKKNIWLGHFTNFIAYISLQIIIGQASIHFYRGPCFVYIGFFLCLPWQKTNLILQLLLGFFVGLIIDAFYNSLGIHAFAVVLLIYCRNLLLHLLPPTTVNDYEYVARPSLYSMGFKKFSIYVLFLTAIYHTTVFFLDAWNFMSFFTVLPQVVISIILSYFFICSFQILSALVSNTSIR